ncbi:MAG TPA: response regulator transcription factor [Blastocatellia bacterium]|nr:response regulator transcription factor [Blastocatellia bacterium]
MQDQNPSDKPATPRIRVAVIEDQREVREGLAMLINGTSGYECTGAFRSMEDALRRVGDALPDVILTDIGLPGMSGTDGIPVLKGLYPDIPLLALTVYDDDEDVFKALCAGASGYLLKNTPPARLLECIKEVANGGAAMSPEIARRVIKLFREISPPERAHYRLTPQETELLKLLVEGHNYKTAAAEMNISINTVSFHLRNIYDKLQVHSKSEAVAKALKNRLV